MTPAEKREIERKIREGQRQHGPGRILAMIRDELEFGTEFWSKHDELIQVLKRRTDKKYILSLSLEQSEEYTCFADLQSAVQEKFPNGIDWIDPMDHPF